LSDANDPVKFVVHVRLVLTFADIVMPKEKIFEKKKYLRFCLS